MKVFVLTVGPIFWWLIMKKKVSGLHVQQRFPLRQGSKVAPLQEDMRYYPFKKKKSSKKTLFKPVFQGVGYGICIFRLYRIYFICDCRSNKIEHFLRHLTFWCFFFVENYLKRTKLFFGKITIERNGFAVFHCDVCW